MSKIKRALAQTVLALAAAGSIATGAAARTIPTGTGEQTVQLSGMPMQVFTYRPGHCKNPSLLIVFHGLGRNVVGYRNDVRALANAQCLLVVAPLFDKERFPDRSYQLGGIVAHGVTQTPANWSGNLVLQLVDWVQAQEQRPVPYYLMGHSAGGQFLSRLAAFVPTSAQRIVIANPSTYVLPTLDVAAPFGLGQVYADKDGQAQLRRYLEQPITIYLGTARSSGST